MTSILKPKFECTYFVSFEDNGIPPRTNFTTLTVHLEGGERSLLRQTRARAFLAMVSFTYPRKLRGLN